MKREDLFLAIGEVEESCLAQCEKNVIPSDDAHMEDMNMGTFERRRKGGIFRGLLIAAIVVTMLATTAFATAGYLLYDSPAQMLSIIFGDKTGFDHSDGSIRPDPWGSDEAILVEPTFDRVPADETVVAQNIAPHVSLVGRSVSWKGYTLTVDAFLYDSVTQCGFMTYLLKNPEGVSGYKLQSDGEIWYESGERLVEVNQGGDSYIIQEKTTDTCLAATYYFRFDPDWGENLEIGFYDLYGYSAEILAQMQKELTEQFKREMTEEEAVHIFKEYLGEEQYRELLEEVSEEELPEIAYEHLAVMEMERQVAEAACKDVITIPCEGLEALDSLTLAGGNITVTPISARIDTTGLGISHVDTEGNVHTDSDEIDSVVIRYQDGSEYVVYDGYILNYVFCMNELPEDNVSQVVDVPAEEDLNGEGYSYVVNSRGYCIYTMMFNRIIDIDNVAAVVINGTEFPVE